MDQLSWQCMQSPRLRKIYKNQYQMPNLLKSLDSAAQMITSNKSGCVWFSSLDLKYPFSQMPLSEAVNSHCNLSTDGHLYAHNRCALIVSRLDSMDLPICPKNSKKLWIILFKVCAEFSVFLDDIIFVSRGSVVEHIKLVEKILFRLEQEVFALNLSKCKLSLNLLSWLGFDIVSEGHRPKRLKIKNVLALEPPRKLKQLRFLMGILNYLQRFLPNR